MSLTLRQLIDNHVIHRLNVGDPYLLQWVVVDEHMIVVDGMMSRFIHADDDNTITFTDTRTDEYVEFECKGDIFEYRLDEDGVRLYKEVKF